MLAVVFLATPVAWLARRSVVCLKKVCIWESLTGGGSDEYPSTMAGMVGRAARAWVDGGTPSFSLTFTCFILTGQAPVDIVEFVGQVLSVVVPG